MVEKIKDDDLETILDHALAIGKICCEYEWNVCKDAKK